MDDDPVISRKSDDMTPQDGPPLFLEDTEVDVQVPVEVDTETTNRVERQ